MPDSWFHICFALHVRLAAITFFAGYPWNALWVLLSREFAPDVVGSNQEGFASGAQTRRYSRAR